MIKTFVITGCAGFIGRHFTDQMLRSGHIVYGVDSLTYAADSSLPYELMSIYNKTFKFFKEDIATINHLPDTDFIVNFAADTHVDNSITDSKIFIHSNVLGVQNLLELTRAKRNYEMPTFIQISTDEVYSDVKYATEETPLNPSNPYAASKAAADLLIQSYGRTYGIKYNIIRPSNCYGPFQYPEKLIPKTIRYLTLGKKVPIHSNGKFHRSWLHVYDAVDAIDTIIKCGNKNEIYNIPGQLQEIEDLVHRIIRNIKGDDIDPKQFCEYGFTRPGMDMIYQVIGDKLEKLGWASQNHIHYEIPSLIKHYTENIRL